MNQKLEMEDKMTSEERIKKIHDDIRLGFINRTIDADGVVRYELTKAGAAVCVEEMVQGLSYR